ncbi:hypothetical protein IAU59_003979 [Kwoniella sp. CBS 9459]
MTRKTGNSSAHSHGADNSRYATSSGYDDWEDSSDEAAYSAAGSTTGTFTPGSRASHSGTERSVGLSSESQSHHAGSRDTSPAASAWGASSAAPDRSACPPSYRSYGDSAGNREPSARQDRSDRSEAGPATPGMTGVEYGKAAPLPKERAAEPFGTLYENNYSTENARQLNGDYKKPPGWAATTGRRVFSDNIAKDNSRQINGDCWDAEFFNRK